jgi:uncharacterized protein (TIGR02271 family)
MTKKEAEIGRSENESTVAIDEQAGMVIPVIQEEVVFEKRVVETGKVRISKQIKEYEETVDEPLLREEVSIEHIPINQFVETIPKVRQEGDVMIIPVVQEQVFVQKRLVLVEELHVRKQVFEVHQPQRVTLRKEEVSIKRSVENENLNR